MPGDDAAANLLPLAVVGAGFSGSLVAVHARRMMPERDVLLFEESGRFGSGLAYGTTHPRHWLNVSAPNMSAYPDHPSHFLSWLRESLDSRQPDR